MSHQPRQGHNTLPENTRMLPSIPEDVYSGWPYAKELAMDVPSDALAFLLWAVLWYHAWLAGAGPKLTIVYLRRFRLSAAQVVVTAALEQGLSKQYRVVTLDDGNFPPMEVPRLYRRISRYAWPVLLSAATAA